MMKKTTIKTIALMIAASLGTSCNSFLDDQPRGYAIAETTSHYEGMLNTLDFMNVICEDYTKFLSPQIIINDNNIGGLYQCLYNGQPASVQRAFKFETNIYEPSENCELWANIYKKIYTYNSIINGVMDSKEGTEEEKAAIHAEARVGRAWMHFVLAQAFSKPYNAETPYELVIPIVKEADTYANDFNRSTMKEFYDFVTSEMEDAVPQMKDLPVHRMRAYMTTGLAIQGKMLWMMGEYQKALTPLRLAYERLKNDSQVSYIRNFNTLLADKYGNREVSLMELTDEQQTNGNCLIPYTWGDPEVLWVLQNSILGGVMYPAYYNAIGYYITPQQYDMYNEFDLRRNLIPTNDIIGMPSEHPMGGISDYSINYGVRVPEIYLALAECEARVGDETKARNVLADFRSYRMMKGHEDIPAEIKTKNELIRFCVEEEDREFLASTINFYNLRRLWNDPIFQYRKPYTHTDGANTYTMHEDNLYLRMPEGILKWNEQWRNDPDQK